MKISENIYADVLTELKEVFIFEVLKCKGRFSA